jgi:hypothetical protein
VLNSDAKFEEADAAPSWAVPSPACRGSPLRWYAASIAGGDASHVEFASWYLWAVLGLERAEADDEILAAK